MRSQCGFTLIELLVVVAIIAVLLALLTPAMDRAIYQAELAACGSNLHQIVGGLTAYALENKRAYPVRETITRGDTTMERPNVLAIPAATSDAGNFAASLDGPLDDRPYLRKHLSLKVFNCPVAGQVDLERTRSTSLVSSSYGLWYGWRYESGTEQGLYRIGNRFTWQGETFEYLATDFLVVEAANSIAWGSHPDDTDRMINRRTQDGSNAGDSQDAATDTEALWLLTGTHRRGRVQANFAATDGAVHRYNDVMRNKTWREALECAVATRRRDAHRAFTLVELLVVVAIIVVLLALLMPALDRAIYQAELAVCGARLNSGALSVLQYALENKRSYPARPGPQDTSWGIWVPELLSDRLHNDRPAVFAAIAPKLLTDPFCPWVADLTTTEMDNMIFTNYSPWFGWRYLLPAGERGMYRLGDRFTYTSGNRRGVYSLLLSDRDRSRENGGLIDSTHPDRDGRLDPVNGQQDSAFGWPGQHAQATYVTFPGQWETRSGGRGMLDLNYAYDDGSVVRFNDVDLNEEEMDFVPETNVEQSDQLQAHHRQLPRR